MRGVTNLSLKKQAIRLRRRGNSYPMIERKLGTPRATLNSWFAGLKLSATAKQSLLKRKKKNLIIIRKKALAVLRQSRLIQEDLLSNKIKEELNSADLSPLVKEFFLCGLYLGEGFKRKSTIGFGNSNPKILAAFVTLVREIYLAEEQRFSCYLHLRYDQNENKERIFWSKQLRIPATRFRKTQFDKRTIGKKTWKSYHGVCVVYCNDARIEKRLTMLQNELLKKIMGN